MALIGYGISTMTSSKIAANDDDIQDGRRQGLGVSHPSAPSIRSTIVQPLMSSARHQCLGLVQCILARSMVENNRKNRSIVSV